ncbi:hypothetical protein XENOCAPTIV_021782 [Xenoophorus captivus]|uniref:C2H2-type domain-containing protein n=1 Tax=Xenoophorus captivus TaxID=1517983 RepID=A0ABV0Q5Q5_9TELE
MHSRSHTGERPHKCKHCSYAAADSSSLKKHLRIHYDERPFKCQICPYASRNSSQLTVHLRSHTGSYLNVLIKLCMADLLLQASHLFGFNFKEMHLSSASSYRCAMKGNLKSHTRINHNTQNLLLCEQCDYKSASRSAMRQHARQHLPPRPFQCSKCSYSCYSSWALKVHERIHSEERPFKCDLCSFASKRLSYLITHREQCHLDKAEKERLRGSVGSRYRAKLDAARAFHCDLCDASFVREDSLRSHKRQHRDSQNTVQLQLSADSVNLVPVSEPQSNAQNEVPFPSSSVASYSNAQIKIIVPQPLGQHSSLIPAGGDGTSKTKMVLLDADNQNVVVNPMIQQVNLLAAVQPLGSLRDTVRAEHQTVLLTKMSSDNNASQESSSSSGQTLITYSSDLEGLTAFIPDGGSELRVVTKKSSPLVAVSPLPDVVGSKPAGPCQEAALVVPNISIGSQNVVIQSVPLIVCTQPQQGAVEQLSPHTLYADSHTPGGTPQ